MKWRWSGAVVGNFVYWRNKEYTRENHNENKGDALYKLIKSEKQCSMRALHTVASRNHHSKQHLGVKNAARHYQATTKYEALYLSALRRKHYLLKYWNGVAGDGAWAEHLPLWRRRRRHGIVTPANYFDITTIAAVHRWVAQAAFGGTFYYATVAARAPAYFNTNFTH